LPSRLGLYRIKGCSALVDPDAGADREVADGTVPFAFSEMLD
jgi:hypothetical protein